MLAELHLHRLRTATLGPIQNNSVLTSSESTCVYSGMSVSLFALLFCAMKAQQLLTVLALPGMLASLTGVTCVSELQQAKQQALRVAFTAEGTQ